MHLEQHKSDIHKTMPVGWNTCILLTCRHARARFWNLWALESMWLDCMHSDPKLEGNLRRNFWNTCAMYIKVGCIYNYAPSILCKTVGSIRQHSDTNLMQDACHREMCMWHQIHAFVAFPWLNRWTNCPWIQSPIPSRFAIGRIYLLWVTESHDSTSRNI